MANGDVDTGSGKAVNLDKMTDDALRALVSEARGLLEKREQIRKREASEQIKKLAKEHGLEVEIKGPIKRARRGRPRKIKPE